MVNKISAACHRYLLGGQATHVALLVPLSSPHVSVHTFNSANSQIIMRVPLTFSLTSANVQQNKNELRASDLFLTTPNIIIASGRAVHDTVRLCYMLLRVLISPIRRR